MLGHTATFQCLSSPTACPNYVLGHTAICTFQRLSSPTDTEHQCLFVLLLVSVSANHGIVPLNTAHARPVPWEPPLGCPLNNINTTLVHHTAFPLSPWKSRLAQPPRTLYCCTIGCTSSSSKQFLIARVSILPCPFCSSKVYISTAMCHTSSVLVLPPPPPPPLPFCPP